MHKAACLHKGVTRFDLEVGVQLVPLSDRPVEHSADLDLGIPKSALKRATLTQLRKLKKVVVVSISQQEKSRIAVRGSQRFESPSLLIDLKSRDSNRNPKIRSNHCDVFMGVRQRSGEGVARRNGCPKGCFGESVSSLLP